MKYKILVATFTAALGLQGALASSFDERACAALKGEKIYDTKISVAFSENEWSVDERIQGVEKI